MTPVLTKEEVRALVWSFPPFAGFGPKCKHGTVNATCELCCLEQVESTVEKIAKAVEERVLARVRRE